MQPLYFDLDGTLVDSLGGISASLTHSLSECGHAGRVIDWRPFVGPPIERMLQNALPDLDGASIPLIVAAFRKHYDSLGVFQSVAYPAVRETLAILAERGHPIVIATNKPQRAAEAVVRHLSLDPFIRKVIGGAPPLSKADNVAEIVAREGLEGGVFIGDSLDDLAAADRIGAGFHLASWGYGTAEVLSRYPTVQQLRSISELFAVVDSMP
jgi:phosphoglycolate phosphatase